MTEQEIREAHIKTLEELWELHKDLRNEDLALALNAAIDSLSHAAGQEADKPLTADMAKALPGGIIDDTTFDQIEHALDRAGAPACDESGKWLTLPQRIAALASGQEATTNPAEIGRKSVGGGEELAIYQVSIDGMCEWMDVSRAEYEHHVSRGTVPTRIVYLTSAQPPASAEVGRDAARLDWIERAVTEKCAVWMLTASDQRSVQVRWSRGDVDNSPIAPTVREAIDAAMAASSGRNESPIAGVTHGTHEGWGDQ